MLPDWCTVVVADAKTPLEQWSNQTFTRVKLLNIESQRLLPFKILSHIPMNHFGRKNIGYLFAVQMGAKYIYDTDDDNILKTDADGVALGIPIVDAKKPPHKVAQAWHCEFDRGKTRSWNPYVVFGQQAAWPRGLPLDDISMTSRPCGHAAVKNISASSTTYIYHNVFHQLPGISFAVQQSLADVNPDVDAIYRLTRASPIFDFDSTGETAGVYGPDNVFAPYNAQATLHEYSAFWAMLLPITVHGRVSDIWRSYVAQTIMWKYGLRVAFMKPWVNQERTVHNYLRDFDSEQPLYLRASALIDFLRTWRPSRDDLPLPGEYEELMVALFEIGAVEESDVLLTQTWLQDLKDIGYEFPGASMKLYDAWTNEQFLGGLSILCNERSQGEDVRKIIPLINNHLTMFAAKKYPIMIFFIDVGGKWMDITMRSNLRSLAPNLRIEFYGTQYTRPYGYKGNGYMFCSQFLAYDMYRHPALQRLTYLFRFDEDITSFAHGGDLIALDYFKLMMARNLTAVGFQKVREDSAVIEELCPRSERFFKEVLMDQQVNPQISNAWDRVNETFCSTLKLSA